MCEHVSANFMMQLSTGIKLHVIVLCAVLLHIEAARPKTPRCLELNRIAWRPSPPYTYIVNGSHIGIVEKIFELGMSKYCCIGGMNIEYNSSLNFRTQGDAPDLLMDKHVKKTFHFVLPVQRSAKSKNYLTYDFIPLVVSPGLAVFVNPPKGGATAIIESIRDIMPFMSIMSLCVGIAGVVFWMLEFIALVTFGEQPEPFSSGVCSGIWWAFVTMTTVGYGDEVPKTKPGRIFSVFWCIVGLVFCGICVSSITTGIIMSITKQEVEIMNAKVAVLKASEEFKYASKKQGVPLECDSVEEIANALHNQTVQIALIDTMIAGHYKKLLEGFTLNKVIETMNSNGVVFMDEAHKYTKCMRHFIMDRQQTILSLVTNNTDTIKFKSFDRDSILIDPSLPMFRYGLSGMAAVFLLFMVCGLGREWLAKRWEEQKFKKHNLYEQQKMLDLTNSHREELIRVFNEIRDICDFYIQMLEDDYNTGPSQTSPYGYGY